MRYNPRLRLIAWICLLALALTLTVACGRRPASEPAQPQPQETKGFRVSLTDTLGRQVTLDKAPQRIISMLPSNTEILFALGLGDRIVAVNDHDKYPPEAATKDKIGGAFDVQNTNIEKIVSLKPDLILAGAMQKSVVEELAAKLDLAMYTMPDAATVQDAINSIAVVGDLTGTRDEAAKLIASLNARVEAIKAKVKDQPKPKVFHEVWGDPLMTAGPGSFIDDMIKLAGGTNIAADAVTPYPQFSLESLIQRNPDVVTTPFKQTADDLAGGKRKTWKGLKAVKDGRVVVLDQDIISRPGPRVVDGLEAFARAIHPGLFK